MFDIFAAYPTLRESFICKGKRNLWIKYTRQDDGTILKTEGDAYSTWLGFDLKEFMARSRMMRKQLLNLEKGI